MYRGRKAVRRNARTRETSHHVKVLVSGYRHAYLSRASLSCQCALHALPDMLAVYLEVWPWPLPYNWGLCSGEGSERDSCNLNLGSQSSKPSQESRMARHKKLWIVL